MRRSTKPPDTGYVIRPSRAADQHHRRGGRQAPGLQRPPARRVRLRGDPAGGQRRGQQRPGRDHARDLHRADLAGGGRVSRRPPTIPARACASSTTAASPRALSYRYQFHCPNQQNLIAVMGREPPKDGERHRDRAAAPEPDRSPPRRHPRRGPCIRCNLQMEGSGVGADDVVIDSGSVESGNGAADGLRQGRRHPRRPRRRLRAPEHDGRATPRSTTSTRPRPTACCSSASRPITTASTACSPSSPSTT